MSDLDLSTLTPATARHILQRMGEAGQPPEQGIRFINVGNESYLTVLSEEYLDRLLGEARGSSFKLVQGYFGAGKTHFLYCMRDLAWQRGFLTSMVGLSASECPFDRRLSVYRAIASRLSLPPAVEGEEAIRGFPAVLACMAEERVSELGAAAFRSWVRRSYERSNIDWHPFRRAVAAALLVLAEDGSLAPALDAWLLGEAVPRSEVQQFGVFEAPSEANAFGMLRSLLQSIVYLGGRGTILLFDEMDRTLSLGRKRTRDLGDNLRQLIDLCSLSELPATLFLYAVPPEFLTQVAPEYPALQQRLQAPMALSRQSPKAPLVDLERLDLDPEPLLVELGERLLAIEKKAHGTIASREDHQNLRQIASAVVNHQLDVSHRRLFVKSFITYLDSRRSKDGSSVIKSSQAVAIIRQTYEGLLSNEMEEDSFSDY